MMQKFLDLVLDKKSQDPDRRQSEHGRRRADTRATRRQSDHGRRRADTRATRRQPSTRREPSDDYRSTYVLLLILIPVVAFIIFSGEPSPPISIHTDTLCPTDRWNISRKTYILVDLSEPLLPKQRAELRSLLKATANTLLPREQLSISQMQALQNDPREEVQRFCSPDISRISRAGSRVKKENCPSIINGEFIWPPSVGSATREDIERSCKKYVELQKQVVTASDRYESVNIEQPRSYIVGSIEDIMDEANDEPSNVPTSLIVFSDMLQNADWFSQYRKSHGQWTIENLLQRRGHADNMGAKPDNNFKDVLLCYLPSDHRILATSRSLRQHKKMWRDYFESTVNFRDTNYSGCAAAVGELRK